MFERSKITLIVSLVLCWLVSHGLGHIHVMDGTQSVTLIQKYAYYYDVLIGIGISIILAVGLNLVNGYTGQFSLGHAGFMAAGAYGSSYLTLLCGYSLGTGTFATTTVFLLALIAGGLIAALTGLLVGVPSLRLKG